jgi:tagatose-1,6-bisphosphate aldolase non-catalytic subunit AgaZ/GatZ
MSEVKKSTMALLINLDLPTPDDADLGLEGLAELALLKPAFATDARVCAGFARFHRFCGCCCDDDGVELRPATLTTAITTNNASTARKSETERDMIEKQKQ